MTDRPFYSLADKVAIVTGAAHGIGAAIAERFLKAGARVVFADIDAGGARDRAGQLDGSGERSLVAPVDLTRSGEVASLVERVIGRFGTVDILVNNAGIAGPTKPLVEVSEEEWDQVMAINLRGVFLCLQGGAADHAGATIRPDRQCGLHRRQGGKSQSGALLDHQGRSDLPHQGPGQGGLPAGHLRELRDARGDRYTHSAPGGARNHRLHDQQDSHGESGKTRGSRGPHPLPGQRRMQFYQRRLRGHQRCPSYLLTVDPALWPGRTST